MAGRVEPKLYVLHCKLFSEEGEEGKEEGKETSGAIPSKKVALKQNGSG